MDEADGIIIRTLNSIGCDLKHDIDQMDADMVVGAVAQCINLIDPSIQVQSRLPPNMAARYRIGTSLADIIKTFGYQGELGYHTFLYSNVAEIRRVFLFLISKLPKRHIEEQKETFSSQALLKSCIRNEVNKSQNIPWVPLCFLQDSLQTQIFETERLLMPPMSMKKLMDDKQQKYSSHYLPLLCNQVQLNENLYPSILEKNSAHLAIEQDRVKVLTNKDSQFTDKSQIFGNLKSILKEVSNLAKVTKPSLSSTVLSKLSVSRLGYGSASLEELPPEHSSSQEIKNLEKIEADNLEQLERKLNDLSTDVEESENEISRATGLIGQIHERIKVVVEENDKRKDILNNRKNILQLTPCADENLKRLQEMARNYKAKLEHQRQQWEDHWNMLSEKFNQLTHQAENNKSESRLLLEEVQDAKMKIKELASQANEKEATHKQLTRDYEKMTDGLKRRAYTQRILEIVASIKKQNQEIDKVILDTKSVQKEINNLSGVVERTFIDADELIFRSAKKDEYARKAYKLLASLHENCNSLVKSVEKTGAMLKDVSDLEEQIEQEERVSENLDKILKDFDEIKQENQTLLQEIKSRTSS